MATPFSAPWRALSSLTAAAVVVAGLVAVSPAYADTAPAAGVAQTVSTDALPTVQVDGIVWSQVVVGNTVYAAGSFATARPAGAAAGVSTTPRANVLAYDLTTGALRTGFIANTNAGVNSIAASPDGTRIYIGGSFTAVNGTTRYRVAALDPVTGAVLAGFAPVFNAAVDVVTASGSAVYFGGNFTAVSGATRTRGAAVAPGTGAVLPFNPVLQGGRARAIAISPDSAKVVLGGAFTSLNGSSDPGFGLGAVDATSGASLPWNANSRIRDAGAKAGVYSLTSDDSGVYGTGYNYGGGNIEGAFRMSWGNGDLVWVEDCHGDTYSAAVLNGVVYTAGHAHYCSNVGGFPQTDPSSFQRGIAFTTNTSGKVNGGVTLGYASWEGTPAPDLLNWWPDFNTGSVSGSTQGPWSVAASGDYVVYAGEFTKVNGTPQQGLVRFATRSIAPNADGPRLGGSSFVPTLKSLTSGTVRASWLANYDRDNQYLTYKLLRDGDNANPIYTTTAASRIWFDRPLLSFTDTNLAPGSTHTYRLRAEDPFGNVAWGEEASVTVAAAGSLGSYAAAVLDDGATNFWRLGESSGTAVTDWAGVYDATAGTGVTLNQAGAITGDANAAAAFSGTATGLVAAQNAQMGPTTFTLEAWFKTTSTTGGKIVGFGSANTGNSASYDRHVYLDGNGRINFGVYPGSIQTVSSNTGYNDGQWHQVVASLSGGGMELFVDGTRAARRTDITSAQSYSGYWRIGGDSTWAGALYLNGSIDDVAVYSAPLPLAKVRQHYTLSGRTLSGPAAPTDTYGAAVYTDQPDMYWRLNDAAASAGVADYSGNNASGIYSGGVTKPVPGFGADSAASFNGSSGVVASTRSVINPVTYSLELWFKTNTTAGGKLIGHGTNQTALSVNYDRHIYLQDDGRLVFGVYSGAMISLTTAKAYNDDTWHQVVGTQSPGGMRLYVDGALQGSNTVASAENNTGYWRVGGDRTWGSTSPYVRAAIDEVAIYSYAVPAATVLAHYRASGVGPNTPPNASFTATPQDLQLSVDASASSDPDGTITAYAWDFGDGTSGTGTTAQHTYAKAGTYTVALTVTDNRGSTGKSTRAVTVTHTNVLPTASFTTTVQNLQLAVDATASTDSDGTIAAYRWDFGDGTAGAGVTAQHTYASRGTYTVTLTVTDNAGATATTTRTATVAPANVPPTAAFTATSTDVTVSVDGTASTDSDGVVSSYSWSFGDGTTATGPTARHAYATAGTYPVTLTVTDDRGATGTVQHDVTLTASTDLAKDSFERAVTGGLGSADKGGAWTLSGGASNFSVSGGAGRISLAAGREAGAFLTGVASTSADLLTSMTLETAPSGGGLYGYLVGRRVGTEDYRAVVAASSTGAVSLQIRRVGTTLIAKSIAGLTATKGDQLRVRLQVVGQGTTAMKAKVWKAGTPEPADWQVTANDTTATLQQPGCVGIGEYVSGSATTVPVGLSFDDFVASPAQ